MPYGYEQKQYDERMMEIHEEITSIIRFPNRLNSFGEIKLASTLELLVEFRAHLNDLDPELSSELRAEVSTAWRMVQARQKRLTAARRLRTRYAMALRAPRRGSCGHIHIVE